MIKLKGLTLGMSYHLAGCCSPIKGDKIVGIVTACIGVSIHSVDCETLNYYSVSPESWLDVGCGHNMRVYKNSTMRLEVHHLWS